MLDRRPVPSDFSEEERIIIWMELKTCMRTTERRLKTVVRSKRTFAKLLGDLQDHYVDFSIALGADDVYSLTEFASPSEAD